MNTGFCVFTPSFFTAKMCEIKDEFIYSNTVRGIPAGKENQQTIIGTLQTQAFLYLNPFA